MEKARMKALKPLRLPVFGGWPTMPKRLQTWQVPPCLHPTCHAIVNDRGESILTPSYADRLALAAQIAQRLGETQPAPIGQIRRIVERIPLDQVMNWVETAQGIETSGGELLPDGSRR